MARFYSVNNNQEWEVEELLSEMTSQLEETQRRAIAFEESMQAKRTTFPEEELPLSQNWDSRATHAI